MLDGNPDCSARLLIVDDEPAIRALISEVLTGIGYRVRSAEDGVSALAEIRNQMPDIILSDLNMPGMSGFELISVVRRSYPSIQVIAMSGAFSGEEAPSGIAADAFYQKGCGPGSLLKIIRALPRLDRISHGHAAAPAPAWN
jgi:CheY-like chemotaxis protein